MLLGVVIAIPANVVGLYIPAGVAGDRPLWFGLLAAGVVAMVVLNLVVQRRVGQQRAAVPWQVPRQPVGLVSRAELAEVVSAVTTACDDPVLLTTGLVGAGGFGKTTLAVMACHDRIVRRRFRSGIWVTVGRDLDGPGLAARISEVVRNLGEDAAAFSSVEEAGKALAAAVARMPRPVLLAVDDVWTSAQLEPFLAAGQVGRLLVTTRNPGVLDGADARRVAVDQMSEVAAERLLTRALGPVQGDWVKELAELAGGWPLLLSLINGRLADAVRRGGTVDAAAAELAGRMRDAGPAAIDIFDSGKRETTATATIAYSLDALSPAEHDRFSELGIFAGDAEVPVSVAAMLWQATARLDEARALELCERLDRLSLVSLVWAGNVRVMKTHDVIRDYLRAGLGAQRVTELNGVFVDTAAASLPEARPLGTVTGEPAVAWWEPGVDRRYLRDHLIWHFLEAGRPADAAALACDLRWVGTRLAGTGPAAVAADLSMAGTPQATRMRAGIARAAHLLAATHPGSAVVDILHSRISAEPDWVPQVTALRETCHRPRLVNRWPLPDLPHSALRAVLEGHRDRVTSVCPVMVAGQSLLASGSYDGTVRVWDPVTGQQRTVIDSRQGAVKSVCPVTVAGQNLLASAGGDKTVRIWNPATGRRHMTLAGHRGPVWCVCPVTVAGQELLASGDNHAVRIWDPVTGEQRAVLAGHRGSVVSVCQVTVAGQNLVASTSLDDRVRIWNPATGQLYRVLDCRKEMDFRDIGSVCAVCPVTVAGENLLASADMNNTVRVWDPATGQTYVVLKGPQTKVDLDGDRARVHSLCQVTVAGQDLLASAGNDNAVRIWDPGTGVQATVLENHQGTRYHLGTSHPQGTVYRLGTIDSVCAVTVAGQGLLASAGEDKMIRIWDPASRVQPRRPAILERHRGWVNAVCLVRVACQPMLASAGQDKTVRIWDPASGQQRTVLSDHGGAVYSVCPVTVAGQPMLASGCEDNLVRIWNPATGQLHAVLKGHESYIHQGWVRSVCPVIVAGQDLLASAGEDRTVRIWDPATGQQRILLKGHRGAVYSVCSLTIAGQNLLASASEDRTIRIWDPVTGQQRTVLKGHRRMDDLVAGFHGGATRAVCPVSVAGQDLLASAGDDKTVRIWNPASGQLYRVLDGHQGPVYSVCAVTVGGQNLIASASYDKTMRIWDPATGQALALMRTEMPLRACAHMGSGGIAVAGEEGLYGFDYLP